MTAAQLEVSLFDAIRNLDIEQRQRLLEVARSLASEAQKVEEVPPLELNHSPAIGGVWDREEIYGNGGR